MGLNETTKQMREVLAGISVDLEKAANGNKAASQRVRTGTIKLEKTAKNYRRESIAAEKSGTGPKRPRKAGSKAASKPSSKAAPKSAQKAHQKAAPKAAHKAAPKAAPKAAQKAAPKGKQANVKARPKAKAIFNPKAMKRPTAKIPFKKA